MHEQARGPVRTVFIGWGAIGSRVGDLLAKRGAPVEIVGVATIDTPEARAGLACTSCHSIVHVDSTMGNADFTIEYPPLHELATSLNKYVHALDYFLTFLNPEADPRAAGYHAIQSRVAIGSGGWFGTGYTQGPQKRLAFLPEQHTDFVFPVVGEEVALSLFLALFLALLRIARRATDSFSSLVTFGILALFFTHVFENVGMTVNLMPITGIPLPFFSYGGSFFIICSLCLGLAFRVAWDSRQSGYPDI